MNPRRTTIAGIKGTPAERRRDKEKKKKKKEPIIELDYVQEPFYARAESKPKPKPKGPAVTVDESALPPKRAKQPPTVVISGGGRRGPKNPSGRRVTKKPYANGPIREADRSGMNK